MDALRARYVSLLRESRVRLVSRAIACEIESRYDAQARWLMDARRLLETQHRARPGVRGVRAALQAVNALLLGAQGEDRYQCFAALVNAMNEVRSPRGSVLRRLAVGAGLAAGLASASPVSALPSNDPPAVLSGAPVDLAGVHEGVATVYAGKFHGRVTASGQVFRHDGLSVAVPLGSPLFAGHGKRPRQVRVTNLENGRSLVLPVTDVGNFGFNVQRGTYNSRSALDGLLRVADVPLLVLAELGVVPRAVYEEQLRLGFPGNVQRSFRVRVEPLS